LNKNSGGDEARGKWGERTGDTVYVFLFLPGRWGLSDKLLIFLDLGPEELARLN